MTFEIGESLAFKRKELADLRNRIAFANLFEQRLGTIVANDKVGDLGVNDLEFVIEFVRVDFVNYDLFQVRVTVQAAAVDVQEFLAFLQGNLAFLHRARHPVFHGAHEGLVAEVHVIEHIFHGFAVNHLVDFVAALVVANDMDCVRVTEEVV